MARSITEAKYLIIGNSAGGIGAAETIREVDKKGSLAIVSDEPYPAYSRPLISEHLAERCKLERMLFRPLDFYERNKIKTFFGEQAKLLDLNERIIGLGSGSKIRWQKLLLTYVRESKMLWCSIKTSGHMVEATKNFTDLPEVEMSSTANSHLRQNQRSKLKMEKSLFDGLMF